MACFKIRSCLVVKDSRAIDRTSTTLIQLLLYSANSFSVLYLNYYIVAGICRNSESNTALPWVLQRRRGGMKD